MANLDSGDTPWNQQKSRSSGSKILPEPHHKYKNSVKPVRESNSLLQRLNLTAHRVATDYLRLFWQYTKEEIRKYQGNDFEEIYDLRIVLTVPAIWSQSANDNTLKAARVAGLPANITLVTEPEAAASATLKDRAAEKALKVGDAFVVCDCGGGTVDLISYEVKKLQPLIFAECAIGDGDLCGSVFLDMCFESHIVTLVGESQYYNKKGRKKGIKESSRNKMTQQFEFGVKRSFTREDDQNFSVDLKGVKDDERERIIDDTIPLKAILLVGGFGENQYLFDRLESFFKNTGIRLLKITDAWSAVCRGATMWGLEHSHSEPSSSAINFWRPMRSISSRISRYSYGIIGVKSFNRTRHLAQDKYLCGATNEYVVNLFDWLIKWGDRMTEGMILGFESIYCCPLERRQSVTFDFSIDLYEYDSKTPPTRHMPSMQSICTVRFDIDKASLFLLKGCKKTIQNPLTNENWHICDFEIEFVLGNATLDFRILHGKKLVGHAQIEYKESFT